MCIVERTATGGAGAVAMMRGMGGRRWRRMPEESVLPCIKPRALFGASVSFAETYLHFPSNTAFQYGLFLILSSSLSVEVAVFAGILGRRRQ